MKLYELPERYASLLAAISDGELTADLERELDLLDATLTAKTDNICRMVRQLDAEAKILDAEAARLKLRASARDNAATRLKAYLQSILEKIGQDRVKTELFTARLWKNSQPSVMWDIQTADIPKEFRREIIELSKTAVIEAWRAGKTLPEGCKVDDKKKHLRII